MPHKINTDKKANTIEMNVVRVTSFESLFSVLCLCCISFSAMEIMRSAAPGTTWSYFAKSSGFGSGPE